MFNFNSSTVKALEKLIDKQEEMLALYRQSGTEKDQLIALYQESSREKDEVIEMQKRLISICENQLRIVDQLNFEE